MKTKLSPQGTRAIKSIIDLLQKQYDIVDAERKIIKNFDRLNRLAFKIQSLHEDLDNQTANAKKINTAIKVLQDHKAMLIEITNRAKKRPLHSESSYCLIHKDDLKTLETAAGVKDTSE